MESVLVMSVSLAICLAAVCLILTSRDAFSRPKHMTLAGVVETSRRRDSASPKGRGSERSAGRTP